MKISDTCLFLEKLSYFTNFSVISQNPVFIGKIWTLFFGENSVNSTPPLIKGGRLQLRSKPTPDFI